MLVVLSLNLCDFAEVMCTMVRLVPLRSSEVLPLTSMLLLCCDLMLALLLTFLMIFFLLLLNFDVLL